MAQVLAYCSKSMDDPQSGCSHVFIDGAEHTIVKMPKSCGRGPYARIASLDVHHDQKVLSSAHQLIKPTTEPVYQLSFDYGELICLRVPLRTLTRLGEFTAIPASNGPVYMRAGA
jgi:hypothetical protein